ncbi:MAG: hypothetical protein HWD86_02085 [Kangiellaceae bacterium]|nr:hypothetical protein [Kangiellaceae bacterium]
MSEHQQSQDDTIESTNKNTSNQNHVEDNRNDDVWPRTRELIILQLKLGLDAIRDFVLMPVAVICYILDFGDREEGKPTYWERLLRWGRRSDHHINLFKHARSYKKGFMTVDDALGVVEETLKKEVTTGEFSDKAINAVKEALSKKQRNNSN